MPLLSRFSPTFNVLGGIKPSSSSDSTVDVRQDDPKSVSRLLSSLSTGTTRRGPLELTTTPSSPGVQQALHGLSKVFRLSSQSSFGTEEDDESDDSEYGTLKRCNAFDEDDDEDC